MSSIFKNNVNVKENLKKYLKDFYDSNDYSWEAGTNIGVKNLLLTAMDFADDLEDIKKDIKDEIKDIKDEIKATNRKLDKVIDLLKTGDSKNKSNNTDTISADWDKNIELYEEACKSIIDRQKARYYEG